MKRLLVCMICALMLTTFTMNTVAKAMTSPELWEKDKKEAEQAKKQAGEAKSGGEEGGSE